jgi:hypothetical protein
VSGPACQRRPADLDHDRVGERHLADWVQGLDCQAFTSSSTWPVIRETVSCCIRSRSAHADGHQADLRDTPTAEYLRQQLRPGKSALIAHNFQLWVATLGALSRIGHLVPPSAHRTTARAVCSQILLNIERLQTKGISFEV